MHAKTCRHARSDRRHQAAEPEGVDNTVGVKENEDIVAGSLDALGNGDILRLGAARQYP